MDTGAPLLIFLAEDNPADVYLIRLALQEIGVRYDIQVVEDGKSAIRLLTGNQQPSLARRPDLIILDLNLPQHDGIEILRIVRRRDDLAEIPVAILTSSDSPYDRNLVEDLRISAYVRKPLELDEFMKIGEILKQLLVRDRISATANQYDSAAPREASDRRAHSSS